MATIGSIVTDILFNELDFGFLRDVDVVRATPTLIRVAEPGEREVTEFLGTGFVLGRFGPTAGTVTGLRAVDGGRVDGQLLGASFAATRLAAVSNTVSTADDFALWADILARADTFTGGARADQWRGFGGADRLNGLGGADTLEGDAGADTLNGGAGNDRLSGGADNDLLVGGAGADRLDGGTGADTASYAAAATAVTARLAGGTNAGEAAGDVFVGVENLIGSRFADRLFGSSVANRLDGGTGNDNLSGGAGNDVLIGGLGADRLDGGAGVDTASYAAAAAAVTARLAGGTNAGEAAGDVFVGVENLIGSRFADRLFGSSVANRLDGGTGNDILSGGAGNDVLLGGAGVDALTGGAGRDQMTGGTGRDSFVFAATAATAAGAPDRITDFRRGEDRIDLAGVDADTDGTAGNQAFTFIGARAFSGVDGQLRFSAGLLQGDVNGDGRADFAVAVAGLTALAAGDFVL